MPVIGRPAPNHGVELPNQVSCCGLLVVLHDLPDSLQEGFHCFLCWFNQQFALILPYMLSEKVKAVFDMRDRRLLLRERKATLPHELFHQRFDFPFQQFFGTAGHDEVIGRANQVHFGPMARIRPLREPLPETTLESIQCEVG
jgi:hypothetical protein